jgi:L-alanine-DL-glutamate epimerase-like enolase superfamily enzyme
MIGGAGPKDVWLYSGAIYMEDVIPQENPRGIQAVLGACRQDYETGYRAFKLKIGRARKWMAPDKGLQRDIEVTRAVHEHFPDCRVLVDANDAFSLEQACRYVAAVADCNLYWIEEAFEENRDSYRRLKDAMDKAGCKALIADGEARCEQANPPTAYGGYTNRFINKLYELAQEKLVDMFVLDLDILGFSRWRRVMPQLKKAGVLVSPHAWMWTMRTHQTAQLAAGIGNIPIVEGIPGHAPGINYSAYKMREGKLIMPDEPGFGFSLEK